jgi:hypothetical protein
MKKFDKNAQFEKMMELFNDIQKTPGLLNQNLRYMIEIPMFLKSIWNAGKDEGIEIGKQKKLEEITKQN